MIQESLLKELTVSSNDNIKEKNLEEEEYYFKDSESLKNFMVQIYACSLINQHLCIVGPPGIGKTIGARKFSYFRKKIIKIMMNHLFICTHFINSQDPVIILEILL